MNNNASITMAVAGILTLAAMTMPLQHHAFGQQVLCPNGKVVNAPEECQIVSCDPPSTGVKESTPNANEWDPLKQSTGGEGSTHIAIGGGGECMSGGAGGAGGEGGQGGTNFVKDTGKNVDVDQKANGGKSNGGYGGNANGGDGLIR
jgi:hypothetical protein